jgi:hypothetical protein
MITPRPAMVQAAGITARQPSVDHACFKTGSSVAVHRSSHVSVVPAAGALVAGPCSFIAHRRATTSPTGGNPRAGSGSRTRPWCAVRAAPW